MKLGSLFAIYVIALSAVCSHAQFFAGPRSNRYPVIPQGTIKGTQYVRKGSGVVFTAEHIYLTKNNGQSWTELEIDRGADEAIAGAYFFPDSSGVLIVHNLISDSLSLIRWSGSDWSRLPIDLKRDDALEADLDNIKIAARDASQISLEFRLPTTSNFIGSVVYRSSDGGNSWAFDKRSIRPATDASDGPAAGGWKLLTEGNCRNGKSGCFLETKVVVDGNDITPAQIRLMQQADKAAIDAGAAPLSLLAPGGTTRISLNRGFDKCTAAPAAQMQSWWNGSPFFDSNIYISGRNRGCSQPQLTAAWVNQVTAMGWGLIPTVVGYQSSCSTCVSCQKHSSDPSVAETQGRGEADIAITDANNLGLTTGTILYYDMERYDDTSGTGACSTPTKAFLKGWTDRLKELGYKSGTYGSPFNASGDWINIPPASQMDAVWLARWNGVMSVFGVAPLADNFWPSHQRIHQWLGPRDETWGGVTFNIDNNISDAPVAGLLIAKHQNADFDGDGKTDVSSFRPDTGDWYILNSSNSTLSVTRWGGAADVLTPGDYDGDGKTDVAVYRPAEGNWYFLTKAGTVNIRNWGNPGDIPAPADYNGDGKTDIAVFRPSDGNWYILNSDSLSTVSIIAWGQAGDRPVQADFDGDGKTDIAVYRPSAGSWYIYRSSDGSASIASWGNSTDQPVQGDYDGDGKADLAVYRSGTWYIYGSTTGYTVIQWGVSGDIAAAGDYDGDGKFDIGIFRPSEATWYGFQSTGAVTITAWGNSTDKPVPSAYFPQ